LTDEGIFPYTSPTKKQAIIIQSTEAMHYLAAGYDEVSPPHYFERQSKLRGIDLKEIKKN
jgi:hypothetical protein